MHSANNGAEEVIRHFNEINTEEMTDTWISQIVTDAIWRTPSSDQQQQPQSNDNIDAALMPLLP